MQKKFKKLKSKKITAAALLLAMSMFGNSMAAAAEFSSDVSAVNFQASGQEENLFSDSEVSGEFLPEGISTNETLPDETSTDGFSTDETPAGENSTDKTPIDGFSTGETPADEFSADENLPDEFSSDEFLPDEFSSEEFSDDEINQIPDVGSVNGVLGARFKNAKVEAEFEEDSSVRTSCTIYNSYNLEWQNYSTYGSRVASYLTTTADGKLMRVQLDAIDGKALVEYYDTSYNIEGTVHVPYTLPIFGGFYESSNNYYLLTGQNNPDKSDSMEVFRVTKYSKDWKALGAASLFGENTTKPFNSGSARMIMDGNILYVRTSHEMYSRHQANVTFSVNTDTMEVVDKLTGVRYAEEGYASHSFNQFIQIDQGKMITLDQCDGFPSRALVLYKYNTDLSEGKFAPRYNFMFPHEENATYCDQINILKVDGDMGDNYTGTSAGGFEYSDSCWLAAGNFDTDGMNSSRNVFVAAVPKNGGEPTVRYFSNYAGTDDSASTPHLVKTGKNSFVLLWSSLGKVYYTSLDGNGQQVGQIYSMKGNLSDCKPIVSNGKLIWYTWKYEVNVFYEIDLSNLSNTKVTKIVNGHKISYGKEVINGTVTRVCTQCGEDLGTAAVPTSLYPLFEKENGSVCYMGGDIDLDAGNTYTIYCGPEFTASGKYLYDCEVISSDPSVVSVNMIGTTAAEITVHKRGTASLIIRSKYNPSAAVTANISVGILNERQYTVRLSQYRFTYDGTEHKPTVTLLKNGNMVAESDYTVSFKGNLVNAGTVNVIVEGRGNLEGTLTREFTIAAADFSECVVTLSDKPIYFYENRAYTTEFTVKDGSKLLKEGKDFTVEYQYNDSPGDAYVIFKGMGNYTSSQISKQFFIVPRDFYYCDITLSGESFTETGKEIEPEVTIKFGEKILQKDKDFTVLYLDNVKPGTAKVRIYQKGDFAGYVEKTFKIVKKSSSDKEDSENNVKNYKIKDCKIKIAASNFVYDGKSKKPKVTVSHNEKILQANKDYTVAYKNNKNAGTATVTISGKGTYTGSVSKTFKIARAKATIKAASKTVTMNSSKKYSITEKIVTDGKVSYKTSDSKTVKISGNKFIALKPGKAVITISAAQGKNYNSVSNVKITITVRPTAVSSMTVKSSSKGKVKVSWKTVKSVSGYEIQYSTSSNMKNAKKITAKSNAVSAEISKMTSKKNYYIRIRSYKTVSGKKYYSEWSTVKKVKVK